MARGSLQVPHAPSASRRYHCHGFFVTIPTVAFPLLFCIFEIICQDRPQIRHLNITRHPTRACMAQAEKNLFLQAAKFLLLVCS
jgi:hypothetical protein